MILHVMFLLAHKNSKIRWQVEPLEGVKLDKMFLPTKGESVLWSAKPTIL